VTAALLTAPERLAATPPPLIAVNWRDVPGPAQCRCEWDFLEAGQPWYLLSRNPACRMHTAPLDHDTPGWAERAEAMAYAARARARIGSRSPLARRGAPA
jgi:hypothetical protein